MNIEKIKYQCRQLDNLESVKKLLKGEDVTLESSRGVVKIDRVFADILFLLVKDAIDMYENKLIDEFKGE